jgi:hypothetical protein
LSVHKKNCNRLSTHILVNSTASGSISVVKALDYLRPQDIPAVSDIESGSLIELLLIRGNATSVPRKSLGSNASQGLVVGVLASIDKLKAKVDILLLVQDKAAQDEVATVEAGKMAGIELECPIRILRQIGQVRSGGWVRRQVLDGAVRGFDPAIFVPDKDGQEGQHRSEASA